MRSSSMKRLVIAGVASFGVLAGLGSVASASSAPSAPAPTAAEASQLHEMVQQLTAEEQLKTGVSDGYVRLSVGIEHIDDILADLAHGLQSAGALAKAA